MAVSSVAARLSVVISTRDRPAELARTLGRLSALTPPPRIVVVDNASRGGLGWLYRHPSQPEVIALPRNLAAAARTVGAQQVRTPYVAFSDDDSWWAPGALPLAADMLDRHPRLGLLAGRTLVGPACRPDPVNHLLAASPLHSSDELPGRPVLGCLACACVVRRSAFLQMGGFHRVFEVGGEETLLCYDLAAAGWAVRYLPELVAHHTPSPLRPVSWRRQATDRRNELLVRWMRRPLPVAVAGTWELARSAVTDRVSRAALTGLVRRLPAALAGRHRLPATVERDIRRLERFSLPPTG